MRKSLCPAINRIVFAAISAGVFSAAAFAGNKFAWTLFYVAAGVFAAGLLYAVGVSFSIKFNCSSEVCAVTAGEEFPWRVTMRSGFFLPVPALRVRAALPEDARGGRFAVAPLSPYRAAYCDMVNAFPRRGIYSVGIEKFESPDYFALFAAAGRPKGRIEVAVMPRVIPIDFAPNPGLSTVPARYGEETEFDGTRQYEPGDALRDVHWKLTAKTGELTVIKRRGAERARSRVVIDVTAFPGADGAEARELENKLLETAVSLIKCLAGAEGGAVTVQLLPGGVKVVRGERAFDEMRLAFAGIEFSDYDLSLGEIDFSDGEPLWFVTGHSELCETALAAVAADCPARLFLIAGELRGRDAGRLAYARDGGVLCAAVTRGSDVSEFAEMFR